MIAEGEISAIEEETEEMIASLDLTALSQKRVPEKGQCPFLSTMSTLPVKRGACFTVSRGIPTAAAMPSLVLPHSWHDAWCPEHATRTSSQPL